MPGYDDLYQSYYGAGYGYAYDVGDAGVVGTGNEHTHFLVWLIVITLIAVSILGGLKFYGFHFVVRT